MSEDTCPGVGRCHGPWSWCPDCDVTSAGPCDMRARGERCDAHPSSAVLRPQLEDARHEVACLDEDTAPLLREAMRAEKAATTARAAANWAGLSWPWRSAVARYTGIFRGTRRMRSAI